MKKSIKVIFVLGLLTATLFTSFANPSPLPTPLNQASVTLAWNASASDINSTNPYNYILEWGNTNGGPYLNSTNIGTNLITTISNMNSGTYYFVVLAEDTNLILFSQYSNQTNFIAPVIPINPIITSLKVNIQ